MWHFRTILAAASVTLSPYVASATVFNFHDTETSALSLSPVSFSFSLDTATATPNGASTTFNGVLIDENGTLTPRNSVGASYTTNLSSPLFFLVDTSSLPFYSGSGTGIRFNTGTFAIADGATDGEGILTISANTTSPVPEPATWDLLLTGGAIAAAAGRFSRRSGSGSQPASDN